MDLSLSVKNQGKSNWISVPASMDLGMIFVDSSMTIVDLGLGVGDLSSSTKIPCSTFVNLGLASMDIGEGVKDLSMGIRITGSSFDELRPKCQRLGPRCWELVLESMIKPSRKNLQDTGKERRALFSREATFSSSEASLLHRRPIDVTAQLSTRCVASRSPRGSAMDRLIKAARSSGSLNLSNRSLKDVPGEVYQSSDAVGDGEKWWEAVELQKLILAHNDIEILKEDLRNLSVLTVLNLSHNKLTQLPAAIGELPMLKSLDVSHNSITGLPDEIGSATSLVKFDCSNNQLKEIPISLSRCLDLSEFKASNNTIISLPEDLANCSKLTKVEVEGNKLTSLSGHMFASWTVLRELNAARNLLNAIPENLESLSRLIRLDLHQNRISSIPDSIRGCSSLAELYMGNNSLHSLPSEMGELSKLGTLDLRGNQLKDFPVEACKLHLSVLDLSNNSLTGLPPEIGKMTTLRKLLLTGNPLRTLRSSLVNGPTPALLRYLRSRLSESEDSEAATTKDNVVSMAARLSISSKELSLDGMGLNVVPSEVWEGGDLVKVSLSKNSIEELPSQLSLCASLQTLILSRNKIKEWPGEILKPLTKLSCLKLDYNCLGQIPPDGFQAVSMLQILDLSGNAASLPRSPAFLCLQQLQELYLRQMRLQEFPSDILSLTHLKILDLGQNSLQIIPEEIGTLTTLTELDLSNNNIPSLPPQLGFLEDSLQALRLEGNPLRSIRRTILDKGTKAILKYLKDKIQG
ncbi:hypothetical protein EUGRSUZ_F03334 [Eucalyptus grandis]|uniref:Leucine-rich repeat-containing N-terminal plant-type domain-containing protein n=2 Tax=Eucalyptus grandis TaxID=71139 RepID=A0A059BV98_EUCGR|nr:hypothetical protein EUGRSUZ_F03334 [Eucalyptus grandis]